MTAQPVARTVERILAEVGALPWPEGRTPDLAELARTLGRMRLIEALDHPGPARLGAARLLLLL